jgi:putative DNA primase/helicase
VTDLQQRREELERMVQQAMKPTAPEKTAKKKPAPTAAAPTTMGLEVRCFADIPRKPIRWLWPGRIARGKFSLIAGDPGVGKSQITASLAAIVTRGGVWPADQTPCELGSVIFLSAEDDAEDTIRPRLEAVGADLSRCFMTGMVRDFDENGGQRIRAFSLKSDLLRLGEVVRANGGVRLVVIDPISAYLGSIDSHKNSDVRALMTPISEFADKHGVAVLGISHLNKSQAQDALLRVSGSLAFVAAARAAFIAVRDRNNHARRFFLPIKNNLGSDRAGYAFTVESVTLSGDLQTSRVVWEHEPVTVTADEILSAPPDYENRSEVEEAKRFLLDVLADGPMSARKVQEEAEGAGYSWATIRRAQTALGVQATKEGLKGGWKWSLPPKMLKAAEDAQKMDP